MPKTQFKYSLEGMAQYTSQHFAPAEGFGLWALAEAFHVVLAIFLYSSALNNFSSNLRTFEIFFKYYKKKIQKS